MRLLSTLGTLRHALSYAFSGANDNGRFTWVTTPSPASPYTYRIKQSGNGAAAYLGSGTAGSQFTARGGGESQVFVMPPELRVDGSRSFASGDLVGFIWLAGGSMWWIGWKHVSATTAQIVLYYGSTLVGTSTATITKGTDFSLALHFNDSLGNVRVWLNGSLEINASYPGGATSPNGSFFIGSVSHATSQALPTNQDIYYPVALTTMTSEHADELPSALLVATLFPNGNTSESDWGSGSGSCTDGAGTYLNWDDYATGAPDDGATLNCGPASNDGYKEVSSLTTFTIPANHLVIGAYGRTYITSNSATKTTEHWLRMKYAGAVVEKQGISPLGASWGGAENIASSWVFDAPPGGGPWTQTIVDGLELGHRQGNNTANLLASALAAVLVAVEYTPHVDTPTTVFAGVGSDAGPIVM